MLFKEIHISIIDKFERVPSLKTWV